jgi:biofilm PGA synthesis N-glycosyltransferase PgaC
MIKRTQNNMDRLYTLSGAIAAYRKAAVRDIGWWGHDALTEDIDVSWKLQRVGWTLKYEPRSLVHCLQPETLRGLWRQRLRWAMGGGQVLLRNVDLLLHPKHARIWLLMIEVVASLIWCYLLMVSTGFFIAHQIMYPAWNFQVFVRPLVLWITCMVHMFIGTCIDCRYDKGLFRNLLSMCWYPIGFWLVRFAVTIACYPALAFRERGRNATWVSPDRGTVPVQEKSSALEIKADQEETDDIEAVVPSAPRRVPSVRRAKVAPSPGEERSKLLAAKKSSAPRSLVFPKEVKASSAYDMEACKTMHYIVRTK